MFDETHAKARSNAIENVDRNLYDPFATHKALKIRYFLFIGLHL